MKLINYLFLLSIGVIWGANFLFNELAIQSIPPTSVATARASIGVIVLTIILQFTNKQRNYLKASLVIITYFTYGNNCF
jgi:drug/metabolite transporter (DMT)-like permease